MGRQSGSRGGGRGQRQGPGRQGGPKAAGPGGNCLCPNCGHKAKHQVGVPCFQMECPKCSAVMVRE